jgi:hypothetical protein
MNSAGMAAKGTDPAPFGHTGRILAFASLGDRIPAEPGRSFGQAERCGGLKA